MLTREQHRHFETFGFIVLRQFFSPREMQRAGNEFETALDALYAGDPFDGSKRHSAILTGEETPFFAGLPEDPRLYGIAEQLYGDCFPITSDANRYVGDSRWHPDHYIDVEKDCYGIKFAYYLDPVGPESGALRVIPGSHRNPFWTAVDDANTREADIRGVPGHVCASEPGDLVGFDVRLWHASCGGAAGRRMCTVVYYKSPQSAEEEKGMRWRAGHCVEALAPKPFVNPHWASNPGNSGKRAGWLEQLERWGFMAPPGPGEEREEIAFRAN